MALGAGPLDVPLGPLQALSTFLPNDASPLAAETESILKNLRTIQEQARLEPPVIPACPDVSLRSEATVAISSCLCLLSILSIKSWLCT